MQPKPLSPLNAVMRYSTPAKAKVARQIRARFNQNIKDSEAEHLIKEGHFDYAGDLTNLTGLF